MFRPQSVVVYGASGPLKMGTMQALAIIDSGFIGYKDLLGSELPAAVTVRNYADADSEDPDLADTTSEHGTGVAEIVHDIAPDAQLYLIKISTNVDLDQAVTFALSQGIDIISVSMGWYNVTPGDGSGEFASMVERATALSPMLRMASTLGPMNTRPQLSQISANSGFSARNPYPGWMASTPMMSAAEMTTSAMNATA